MEIQEDRNEKSLQKKKKMLQKGNTIGKKTAKLSETTLILETNQSSEANLDSCMIP